jgi:hypothetical protein
MVVESMNKDEINNIKLMMLVVKNKRFTISQKYVISRVEFLQ